MAKQENITKQKLTALSEGRVSPWSEQAAYRSRNGKWLRYSSNIARRILAAMEDANMHQKDLAQKIGVTPQQISKLVRGEENLTLETIAKLSDALGTELISFPDYKHSKSVAAHTVFELPGR